jgi:hypothetical protein
VRRGAASILLAGAVAGCGGSSPPAAPDLRAGSYEGAPACTGADRGPGGRVIDRFRSHPEVTVSLDGAGRVTAWTYVFLGDRHTLVESRAVRPGQTFSYVAGAHIGKPGRTTVTILTAGASGSQARITAALDWESPSTGYVGSGTYSLRLRALGDGRIEYHSEKAVVKTPPGRPSPGSPVVRRTETCLGPLSS